MRDKSFCSQKFISQVSIIIEDNMKKNAEVLSRLIPSGLVDFENRYFLTDKRLDSLILLAIISWYVPEDFGVLLRMEIEEKLTFDTDFVRLLLQSKGHMLLFLSESTLWHTRDFFGNLLTDYNIRRIMRTIRCQYRKRTKVQKPERHRGYRDKGTLRLPHTVHSLWNGTNEMMALEIKRKIHTDSFLFLRGLIE